MTDDNDERALVSTAGQTARRDFSGSSLALTNPATEALVAKERAGQEARWIVAMRAPRNMMDVRDAVLKECRRPGFADVATYSRPVGKEKNDQGKWVETYADGLSIRFAEVAMRHMRNMECKATVTYDDARMRMITVCAVDYETNATWSIDLTVSKTVERRFLKEGQRPLSERVNSYGDLVYLVEANDQQVAVKAAAEISKAARTCILRLIPGELQDEAFDLCRQVAADKAAKDPKATVKRMLDSFSERGVKPSEIETWLGHSVEAATRDELLELSRIASGLREGELIWADVLADREASRAAAKEAKAPAQGKRPKGAAGLKQAVAERQPAPPAYSPHARTDLPPGTPPPEPGNEYRDCSACGTILECPVTDPAGTRCEACSASAADS